ncbi:MAG: trypsin-like serine protease [Phycisphaerae bacterium]|jgi:hypothetical protein
MNVRSSRNLRPVTFVALITGCIAVPSAWAIVIRHDREDRKAIELAERFDAAGQILPDGGCTLIAPNWVATAAHVAQQASAESLQVRFGDKSYKVEQVVIHPKGKSVNPGMPPEVDLALLKLTEPAERIEPAAIYREKDELGKTVVLVGYGDVGDGKQRPRRSDGKRRAATNVIDDAGPLRIMMKFDGPPGGTDLEGVSGPGDSGGPALIEKGNRLYLVGVSSAAMNGRPGRYGVIEVYTRVSSFADWIDRTIRADSDQD